MGLGEETLLGMQCSLPSVPIPCVDVAAPQGSLPPGCASACLNGTMPLKGGSGQRAWVETCRNLFKVGGSRRSPRILLQILFGMGMASHSHTDPPHAEDSFPRRFATLESQNRRLCQSKLDQFWFGVAASMKDTLELECRCS